MKRGEITLEIDVFTPDTLPMSRLAQYLTAFSELLGHEANVHFSRLTKGSANCRAFADVQVVPKIRERVESVINGNAPKSALKAHAAIDDLLAADNAIGGVYLEKEKVIEYPGRRRAMKEKVGPVRRATTIDGQIFSLGGRDETINVHLRNKQQTYRCEVSIDLARKLASHFLTGNVRLFGQGEWYRIGSKWEMARFIAVDFIELDSGDLRESIDSLRGIFSGIAEEGFVDAMRELRRG